VFAIDFIGNGLSSRPSYSAYGVEAAEQHHIDCIERWRLGHGLERVILVGHSFGGYMAAAYALAHPDRVEKLVLVSPVGVPRKPDDADQILEHPDWRVRTAVRFARHLFTSGYTPQWLIRSSGPLGPGLIRRYVQRRFQEGTIDKDTLAQYMYHVCAASGSGEYALSQVLDAGIYARMPLVDRMKDVKCPTVFLYGSHDWMDYRAAIEAAATMQTPADVRIIPRAGHYLFIDNAAEFNQALVEAIESEPDMADVASWPQKQQGFSDSQPDRPSVLRRFVR
jgi:pimeloyl-ACP methyl ester carboxylesterase